MCCRLSNGWKVVTAAVGKPATFVSRSMAVPYACIGANEGAASGADGDAAWRNSS